jgi:hypothetical protein
MSRLNKVNVNEDVMFNVIQEIKNLDDLKNLCSANTKWFNFCKQNDNFISKHLLNIYQVDYKDSTNFIYVYNNKNQDEYQENGKWKFTSLLRLYMKTFYKKKIDVNDKGITSIPILPNMEEFFGNNNKLTEFPVQPKMILFVGNNNLLTTFPVQPNLRYFFAYNNRLTTFPIQPEMVEFRGHHNKLTTFPIQPKMIVFRGNDNELITFPTQPEMTWFFGLNNLLTELPPQPNIITCEADPGICPPINDEENENYDSEYDSD